MNSFRVHILAADHTFYDGPCESLIIPAPDGQYGIWAGHANTICATVPGTLYLRVPGGEEQLAAVSSGVVKIEDNDVLVLVDSAEHPEDIDRPARAARGRCRERSAFAEAVHPRIPRGAPDALPRHRAAARQIPIRTMIPFPFPCRVQQPDGLLHRQFLFSDSFISFRYIETGIGIVLFSAPVIN